jgi:hypothetical protein
VIVHRVLFTGSRSWGDVASVDKAMQYVQRTFPIGETLIIEGGAPGLDTIAKNRAWEYNMHVCEIHALWGNRGAIAGPSRNAIMLSLTPTLVIAFHWDIVKSRGTKNCVTQALALGIPVKLVKLPRAQAVERPIYREGKPS